MTVRSIPHGDLRPSDPDPDAVRPVPPGDHQVEVYPHHFTSRHRRFHLGEGPGGVEVDVWSHDHASWVALSGSLAPAGRRPLTRLLAAECGHQRSITINTGGLDTEVAGDLLAPVALTLAAVGVPVHLVDGGDEDGSDAAGTDPTTERPVADGTRSSRSSSPAPQRRTRGVG